MKITRRQLRRHIKNTLLKEGAGMVTAFDLDPSVGIAIIESSFRGTGTASFVYASFDENNIVHTTHSVSEESGPNGVYGTVSIMELQEGSNCGGAWGIIGFSEAAHGYGPLLYDIAIEYASKHGTGLVSDRGSVSDAAQGVWRYYDQKRSDVVSFQCDDMGNTLTDDPTDNMRQDVARSTVTGLYATFDDSPLSRRYSKKPDSTIEYFKRVNRWEDYGY
jgi:hypothetical protein